MMAGVQSGCLVVADISGYTKFLTGVELEHSTDILGDLIGVVVEQLAGVATLTKLEGDAAFCASRAPCTAEALVTALMGTYAAFRRRQRDISHLTTCQCQACSRIPSLDLKIVAHHGEFVEHTVAGRRELTGTDVILVHRLLKNTVTDSTGLRGYALFTDALVDAVGIDTGRLGLTPSTQYADDVGPVAAHLLDLDRCWRDEETRTIVFVADDAVRTLVFELPATPSVVWDWYANPRKRMQWNLADRIDVEEPDGPSGVGTVSHCVHGKTTIEEEILDWKPFRYVTLRIRTPGGSFVMTMESEDNRDGSTRAYVRVRPEGNAMRRLVFRRIVGPKVQRDFTAGMARLAALLAEEARAGELVAG
jgi:uncharacterized protein YndB with AHSA1/START domain